MDQQLQQQQLELPQDLGDQLCCLAIPADMSVADFCTFCGAYLEQVSTYMWEKGLTTYLGTVGSNECVYGWVCDFWSYFWISASHIPSSDTWLA